MQKRIHFIAIGGAAMHNLALDLKDMGYIVTGSDDEIYEPSFTRLKEAGILPEKFGWFPEKISSDLSAVILGMHARLDNAELLEAQKLGIRIYSYPEFVYQQSVLKKRVVVAGSHGKTTTTAMIMFVLKKQGFDFDYLVGAQLDGFEKMVRISDAPLIIIEGDEYLSSPIDRIPKIMHYHPHITVITGIAWDHINVFPTFEIYKEQFANYIKTIEQDGTLIFNQNDPELSSIVADVHNSVNIVSYQSLEKSENQAVHYQNTNYPISVIGNHNLANMNAALLVCQALGITPEDFLNAIRDFTGAGKRLQKLSESINRSVFLDFAHAPSKVTATCTSVKEWFGSKKLLAVLELHTFSSLNEAFMPQYKDSLKDADKAYVFYNIHTLKMKNMPLPDDAFIKTCFNHPNLEVITDENILLEKLKSDNYHDWNILLMTSGNFNKMDISALSN
ncbi:MAG: peptidoglycan synthetase [Saprospiraceae bacterium]|nr:peptidoglycan synthetase [Saprospiraceae bacterium]